MLNLGIKNPTIEDKAYDKAYDRGKEHECGLYFYVYSYFN